MDKRSLFLSIGIADLLLVYVLSTIQQYFSLFSMFSLGLMVLSGFLLILISYYKHSYGDYVKDRAYLLLVVLSILSVLLILYESFYDSGYVAASPGWYGFAVAIFAALMLAFSVYEAKKHVKIEGKYKYLLIVAVLIAVSLVIFAVQAYEIGATHWVGTDELAFDYYSASLFAHGTNPYNASMAPVLASHKIYPTLTLNGGCECSYDYPALSFLSLLPIAFLSYQNFVYVITFLSAALAVFVSFLLYKKSGSVYAIIPIVIWFIAFIYHMPAYGPYVAICLFLLLGYIYRKRLLLASLFLGVAASIHPLSWLALPFFMILILKEQGKIKCLESLGIIAAIFLITNAYFIAVNPHILTSNIFGLFLTRLHFSFASIMPALLTVYPVAYWYSALIIALVMALALLLFYLYTSTLRVFIAAVPMFLFFLSWRNVPEYVTAFIPLLIAVYYIKNDDNVKDILSSKKPILYSVIILAVVALATLVYAHNSYLNSTAFKVTQIGELVGQNNVTGAYELAGLNVTVSSEISAADNLSFYVASRDPDNFGAYGNLTGLPARGSHTYMLTLPSTNPNRDTKFYVFTMSNGYMSSTGINTK